MEKRKGISKLLVMSLVDKKLIDWILSIVLLPDSGAMKDPNSFKIIQTTRITANLISVS